PQMQTQTTTPGWHRFGEPSSFPQPGNAFAPRGASVAPKALPDVQTADQEAPRLLAVSSGSDTSSPAPAGSDPARAWPANVTLFALTDGTVFPVNQYWRDQDELLYESEGDRGTLALKSVDWSTTTTLNAARHVRVTLRNAPSGN